MSPNRAVALLVSGDPQGGAVVGDEREVDVGHLLPDGRRLGELRLPVGGRELRVERLLEIAGHAADVRAVGHEAVSDQLGLGPLGPRGRIEQEPIFQSLQSRTYRPRPACAVRETSSCLFSHHGILLQRVCPDLSWCGLIHRSHYPFDLSSRSVRSPDTASGFTSRGVIVPVPTAKRTSRGSRDRGEGPSRHAWP